MNQNTSHIDQPNTETLEKGPEGKLEQGEEASLYKIFFTASFKV
jgi:hypothetical protein